MKGMCICQICTCGRHRCPHQNRKEPTHMTSQCNLTEYKDSFGEWQLQGKVESMRPPVRQHTSTDVPMDMDTIYKETYTLHKTNARKPESRIGKYDPPTQKLASQTTYKQDFISKDGSRAQTFKPESVYTKSVTKFADSTMYQISYTSYGTDLMKWSKSIPVRHQNCIKQPTEKFKATSTVMDDFKKHDNVQRAEPIRPRPDNNNNEKNQAFHGNTTYRDIYTEKNPEPTRAIKPKDITLSPCPFIGVTTAMADFQKPPYKKPPDCFKPLQEYVPCKVKFNDRTSTSDAYREWPVQKMNKCKRAHQGAYSRSAVTFGSATTYRDDFQPPKSIVRAMVIKPASEMGGIGTANLPYEKRTHYMEKYVPYTNAPASTSVKVKQKYEAPTEKFAAESTYQKNYTGDSNSPADIYRPVSNHRMEDTEPKAPTCFKTSYGANYTGARPKSCPVPTIIAGEDKATSNNYELIGNKNGHQYFEQRK